MNTSFVNKECLKKVFEQNVCVLDAFYSNTTSIFKEVWLVRYSQKYQITYPTEDRKELIYELLYNKTGQQVLHFNSLVTGACTWSDLYPLIPK